MVDKVCMAKACGWADVYFFKKFYLLYTHYALACLKSAYKEML